jgi:hypothetical protein
MTDAAVLWWRLSELPAQQVLQTDKVARGALLAGLRQPSNRFGFLL